MSILVHCYSHTTAETSLSVAQFINVKYSFAIGINETEFHYMYILLEFHTVIWKSFTYFIVTEFPMENPTLKGILWICDRTGGHLLGG